MHTHRGNTGGNTRHPPAKATVAYNTELATEER